MAALQERAVEDILRIREIQTRKNPLNTLLQRGVVGDEIWQRLLRAEQELEAELKDVVAEANALAAGWGNHIFQSANEIVVNRLTKTKIEEKRAGLEGEKMAWEAVREASRRELEGESEPVVTGTAQKKGSVSSASVSGTNESTPEKMRPRGAQVAEGSDEDAVMVETPGVDGATVATTPDTGAGGGGGKKKKKGKK